MNMFIQCPLPMFGDDANEAQQSFSHQNPEANNTAWNVFKLEELKLVDFTELKDRKSTGLEFQSMWDDSLTMQPSQSKDMESENNVSRSSHKNQTKNIPKNYGKATILYIKGNKIRVRKLLDELNLDQSQFDQFINESRCRISTIKQIRSFWTNQKFGKAVRILSFEFVSRHSLKYIFNSRIKNHTTHVKYRGKLLDGLRNPEMFTNIKDF